MGEDERKDRRNDEETTKGLSKIAKKDNKSKFLMIAKRLAMIIKFAIMLISKYFMVILATLVVVAIIYWFDLDGDNSIASVASSTLIKDKENVDIAEASEEDGYYFKINKELAEKYLIELNKAAYYGYWESRHQDIEEKIAEKGEYVHDPDELEIEEKEIIEWFRTEDYEPYFIKMIKAEIASSYPKLGDYEGIDDPESERNKELGNKKDKDGNYVAQGIVQIQRTKIDKDGNSQDPVELKYLPLEKLRKLIEEDDEKALDYFSFEEGLIYYATWKEVVVTVNGVETSSTYEINEEPPISYKTIANTCSMPYNFLFTLLQEGKDPDWVMAVVDLLLEESEVILMIQDQLNITTLTRTEVEYHAQKTFTEHFNSVGSENTGYHWVSIGISDENYTFPVGEPVVTIIETKTYTNTANVFIKKAKTWCLDFEQEAILIHTKTTGEEYTTIENYTDADLAGLRIFYNFKYKYGRSNKSRTIKICDSNSNISWNTVIFNK